MSAPFYSFDPCVRSGRPCGACYPYSTRGNTCTCNNLSPCSNCPGGGCSPCPAPVRPAPAPPICPPVLPCLPPCPPCADPCVGACTCKPCQRYYAPVLGCTPKCRPCCKPCFRWPRPGSCIPKRCGYPGVPRCGPCGPCMPVW